MPVPTQVYACRPQVSASIVRMPALEVLGMGPAIGAGFIKSIVEFQVQMVRLQVDDHQDGRHRPGKFPNRVENILGLLRHTSPKLFAVPGRGAGLVGQVRGVALSPVDHVVPTGVPAARHDHQQFL